MAGRRPAPLRAVAGQAPAEADPRRRLGSVKSSLRYFFRRHLPPASRILLIESGSRNLIEGVIPFLRAGFGESLEVDVVTCYPGSPRGCDGEVFRIGDYGGGAEGRGRLLAALAARNYRLAGMICSAEPIMTKWKWWLAARLPSKFLILNENGDYFWFDW